MGVKGWGEGGSHPKQSQTSRSICKMDLDLWDCFGRENPFDSCECAARIIEVQGYPLGERWNYCISLVIRWELRGWGEGGSHPKQSQTSRSISKMDLDLWDCFGRENSFDS